MKRLLLIALFVAMVPAGASAQKIAVKTNLLYDATATVNLGLEAALSCKFTLDVSGNYNGWTFGDARWKHWLVQPELRYWFCDKFNGHFIGLHGHYARYNVGGIGFVPTVGYIDNLGFVGGNSVENSLRDNRYQGYLYGAGISWGYQWMLSDRWNLEATIGAGYARMHDTKYPIAECGDPIREKSYNYWGITKVGLSFIFFIN